MDSKPRLADILRNIRMSEDLSFRTFAATLGIGHITYYRFETSWRPPTHKNLRIIIEVCLPKVGLSKDDPFVKEAIKAEVERIIWREQFRLDKKASYLRKRFGLDE